MKDFLGKKKMETKDYACNLLSTFLTVFYSIVYKHYSVELNSMISSKSLSNGYVYHFVPLKKIKSPK